MTDTNASLHAGQSAVFGRILDTLKRGDIALALGIACILVVLVLPMPSWLLDISLALSITFSVLILMTVLFIEKPLDFSSFPMVLLIATMVRLSLNLASTRLILAGGHDGPGAAGRVIEAFGNFVMDGNFVIGIIIFAILVIVNFVVITKGSGRIAEVAARFNLDALPGKQMAIDADLQAGLIDETQARTRRKQLEDESGFFGAMDGAAKFVRGDAIACLLITFINIIGGIIIGVAQMGLSFADAAHSYTLLTVGDGLVSQIPALIVSVASGILVSKAGAAGSADRAFFGQLGGYPRAMGVSCFLMVTLAVVPGVPAFPFLLLGGIAGGLAWTTSKRQAVLGAAKADEAAAAEAMAAHPDEPIAQSLQIDQVRLELGYGLLSMINGQGGHCLTGQIKSLRRQLAQEMGFVLPSVRIQDNLQLPADTYVLRIKEIEAGRGELRPAMILVMDPRGEEIALSGEDTVEPTFGLPAKWCEEAVREEALVKGYTVIDPPTVITTHITELVKDNMAELLSYAATQKLLDELDEDDQKLVSDLVPALISIGGLQRVLQNLMRERISIRDLPTILEGVFEASGFSRQVGAITEHVRARLARQISNSQINGQGFIPLVTLSADWERSFSESLVGEGEERHLTMAPNKLQEFIAAVRKTFERHAMMGETPVLLTSPGIRPFVRAVVERFRPTTVVLSQNEIHPKAKIKTLGQI
jgi:flagellar biosynthesis protein FlhA